MLNTTKLVCVIFLEMFDNYKVKDVSTGVLTAKHTLRVIPLSYDHLCLPSMVTKFAT